MKVKTQVISNMPVKTAEELHKLLMKRLAKANKSYWKWDMNAYENFCTSVVGIVDDYIGIVIKIGKKLERDRMKKKAGKK